jgi:hypothetical protein
MDDEQWAESTYHADQPHPGRWEGSFTWNDGEHERREWFRPQRGYETRCDRTGGGMTCCLPEGHGGPHVPVCGEQAAMPFIIAT